MFKNRICNLLNFELLLEIGHASRWVLGALNTTEIVIYLEMFNNFGVIIYYFILISYSYFDSNSQPS